LFEVSQFLGQVIYTEAFFYGDYSHDSFGRHDHEFLESLIQRVTSSVIDNDIELARMTIVFGLHASIVLCSELCGRSNDESRERSYVQREMPVEKIAEETLNMSAFLTTVGAAAPTFRRDKSLDNAITPINRLRLSLKEFPNAVTFWRHGDVSEIGCLHPLI
jgi:hypothetical protein